MTIETPRRSRRSIPLTPLIDVVFNLLVFFLLASSFADWRSIDLALPPRDAVADPSLSFSEVRLATDGGITLDGARVPLAELEQRTRHRIARNAAHPFVIRPAPKVPLQPVISVLDRLTAAGARDVSLAEEADR